MLLEGAAEAREGIDEECIEPALELLVKDWLWPSPGKLPRAQITAKLASINDWGSGTKGPIQTMVSTALEDLLMVFDLTSKRKAAKEDEGNERKIRAVASGTKALEQHCLKSGDGNDHNFLDHVKDYVRNGKAAWDVKDRLVKAKMWSSDTKKKDVLPYNMVPEKHVFVLLKAGIDMLKTQNTEKVPPSMWVSQNACQNG